MAWDAKKNKVLATKRVTLEDKTVVVEIFSYDKGEPKVHLLSEIEKKGGDVLTIPTKSMTPEMAIKVAVAMKKLCKTHLGID